jgi:predicted flap endonuclease-1-like 5' DNA nuclease
MSTRPVERHRNWAVYILVLLAIIAGILAFLDAARYMGWLPITETVPGLGEINFVVPNAQWFAALMSAIVGIIWFVVAWWLWTLNPSGWLFVIIIAIFNIILLLLAVLGKTTFNQILPALLVNGLALILALLPGTKAAFTPTRPSPQAAATAASAAAAQRAATAVPPATPKPVAPAATVAPKVPPVTQDLTKVEGVGPKVAAALSAAGITSYAQLAAATPDQLRAILADAGISADPGTWPEQARLAAAGKWDELKAWQDKLEGGR